MAPPIKLGELLTRAGVLSEDDLARALDEQRRWGGRLGSTLVRMGLLTEDLLVKALSKQLGLPRANLEAINIPQLLLRKLDRTFCERNIVVPLAYDQGRNRLLVAVSDPFNLPVLDELSHRVGIGVDPYLASESSIMAAVGRVFGGGIADIGTPGGPAFRVSEPPGFAERPATNPRGMIEPNPPPAANPGVAPPSMPPQSTPPFQSNQPLQSNPPLQNNQGDAQLHELADLAQKQSRALQAVVELLIEKGVLRREEYMSWLSR